MNFSGIVIGAAACAIIGLLHPVVIKTEYYWGKKCWPAYAVSGLLSCIASIFTAGKTASILFGILAFSIFWSIHELFEQEKRVKKGWFPANPNRKKEQP